MVLKLGDEGIKQQVVQELRWDTRVEETEIGVSVSDRVVTLTGMVSSYARKLAAQEAAHRVPGVLDVANDIRVRVPGSLARTDAEIAAAVRHALTWDVMVPDERIRSTVADGWVTLEGSVAVLREREDAARAVHQLAGVRGVTNDIVVSAPEADPEAIRAAIEQALERHAHREARQVDVQVADGVVTLSGALDSWVEREAVVGLVSHTPGVRAVNDRLTVGA